MSEGKPFISCGQLFEHINAYDFTPETENLFIEATNETLHWHITNNSDYKNFLAENGIIDFKRKYLPENISPLLIDIFQKYPLLSVPEKQIKLSIASQNNPERKLLLDARSHKRILKIYENIFKTLDMVSYKQKVNYICLTPDLKGKPNQDDNFFYNLLTDLTAHRSVYYAFKTDLDGKLKFNIEETANKIIDFSCHTEPIRIIGPSNFLKFIFDWFEENNIRLNFVKNSFCLILEESMDNTIFQTCETISDKIEYLFGIPKGNCKKVFILPEQGIPFISCKCGKLHIPIYSRAFIVDPETLLPVEDGQEGLLVLMTPYISSFPAISLLTSLKAKLENDCECGLDGKSISIIESYNDNICQDFL